MDSGRLAGGDRAILRIAVEEDVDEIFLAEAVGAELVIREEDFAKVSPIEEESDLRDADDL